MIETLLKWLISFLLFSTNTNPSSAETLYFSPIPKAEIELATTVASPIETFVSVATVSSPSIQIGSPKPEIATSKPEVVINNIPPNAGKYSKQSVKTDSGIFTVSLVGADATNTKIIVDTASNADCNKDCPVLSLKDYVSKNGGWAGINGTYFCPKEYPTCVGKENSFDLLVMNKDKYYFNSNNNIYSTNPAVIFGSGYIRFVNSGNQWGRDTSVNGVLMNYPLMIFNGELKFNGDGDTKKGSKGSRSFVANKGSVVYIGVTQNVTVAENALVMKALGMENALNLDSGGSTALWYGGYKIGPGRNIPNAIIFK